MLYRVSWLIGLLSVLCVTSVAPAANIISDPVEPGGGWTAANGFGDGFGLTTPVEGANLINIATANADPASVTYANLLGAGTYTATFWVHNYSNNPSPPPGLNAHLQAGGIDLDDLLMSAVTPAPAPGAWTEWTLIYDVPFGDPRIGDPLGFLISDVAGQGNGAFDSLAIDFEAAAQVPEPASVALWVMLLGGCLWGFAIRRRR
jgi:hypothetical protein